MQRPLLFLALLVGLLLFGALLRESRRPPVGATGLVPGVEELPAAEGVRPEELPERDGQPAVEPPRPAEAPEERLLDSAPATREVALEEGVVVEGQLVELLALGEHAPQRPAPGQVVRLLVRLRHAPAREALTDADGRFRFELPELKRPRLTVVLEVEEDETYREVRLVRSLRRNDPDRPPELLQRVLHGVPRGVVKDADGRRLAGVEIVYRGLEGEERVSSNLDGSFKLTDCDEWDVRDAHLEGYLLERARESRRRQYGGWSAGELILRASGSLRVRVVDAGGAPLEGALVRASDLEASFARRAEGETQRDGYAELKPLPSAEALAVSVEIGDLVEEAVRQRRGELLFGEAPTGEARTGEAILAGTPAATELRARMVEPLCIRGRVRGVEDGEGTVVVRSTSSTVAGRITGRLDEDDRFELAIPSELRGAPLIVTARVADPAGGERLARRIVDPTWTPGGGVELDLEPSAALSIRGRITGIESFPGPAWAIPAGAPRPLSASREGRGFPSQHHLGPERAEFCISGLAPGMYDLVVRLPAYGTWIPGVRVFPGIQAGASDVLLDGSPEESVTVTLVPEPGSAELSLRVRLARLFPVRPGQIPGPPERIDDPFACFPGLTGTSPSAVSPDSRGDWITTTRRYRVSGPLELPPTEAGYYAIRVEAESLSGKPFAPVSTPAMHLQPGELTLRYALLPAGTLSLDCSAVRDGHDVLQVRDSRRGCLPLPGAEGSDLFARPLRHHTRVRIKALPAGEYELWIGTLAALAAERAAHRLPVEIRAGKTTKAKVGD